MHVYFSGIGGSGISALALIAHQADYKVSGSDAQAGDYIDYLKTRGVSDIHIGQSAEQIAKVHEANPIDWFVYSSALPKTDSKHPELAFCEQNNIKTSKRDEFLNQLITDKKLKMIAIAGTHGKTTTTAMAVWVFKQLGLPVSYSVGGKISFGDVGHFDPESKYFIYEADEYDRNFLSFYPEVSLISGLDWDHPDIYPTQSSYDDAFREFIDQSTQTVLWHSGAEQLGLEASDQLTILDAGDAAIDSQLKLPGLVNRQNAWLVANGLQKATATTLEKLVSILNDFPGVSRRFEQIVPNLYSDYAHTPAKIRGALQLANEVAGDNVVVIYEGLHNTRQHFIKDDLANLFDHVKQLYVVPSFLAREDPKLKLLSPEGLLNLLSNQARTRAASAKLDDKLAETIKSHLKAGDLVLALSAGSTGSLDDWLRKQFSK